MRYYISVGENEVADDLYKEGLHGIEIEPCEKKRKSLFLQHRNNLIFDLAASDHAGTLHLYHLQREDGATISTTSVIGSLCSGNFLKSVEMVQAMTIDQILYADLVHDSRSEQRPFIDSVFLNTGGTEYTVLRGFNLWRWIPSCVYIRVYEENEWEYEVFGNDMRLDACDVILRGAQYRRIENLDSYAAWSIK